MALANKMDLAVDESDAVDVGPSENNRSGADAEMEVSKVFKAAGTKDPTNDRVCQGSSGDET